MSKSELLNISVLPIQALISVALVVLTTFLLLKLIRRYLFVLVKSETWNQRVHNAWPRIEISIWLFVILVLLIFMLNKSFLVSLVVLGIVFIIGGRYWRDIVNGIIIKFENRIDEGDFLSNKEFSGVILNLGLRSLQIRLDGGDIAFISYRSLSDFKVRKLEGDLKNEMSSVTVKFKPEIPVESAIKKLKVEAMQIPYTMLTHPVMVEVIELNETGTLLRVLIHTQNSESGKLVELALNKALKGSEFLA
jgi:small conductance mechanosensitive channel